METIKGITYKYLSVFLAALVLFSTISFAVEKHYCHDTLVDVSLFANADKCGGESSEGMKKRSCCKDVVEIIQGQDELKLALFDNLSFDQQLFITSFTVSYLQLFESLPRKIIPHEYYSPPNLIYDIQLIDQVFLI